MDTLIDQAHRLGQLLDDRLMKASDALTPRQLLVLRALCRHDGMSQTAIVSATGIDRSTLSDIVRRLTKRGCVTRRRSREDARAYVVRCTDEGKSLVARYEPVLKSLEGSALAVLSAAQRQEFSKLLGLVIASLAKPQ